MDVIFNEKNSQFIIVFIGIENKSVSLKLSLKLSSQSRFDMDLSSDVVLFVGELYCFLGGIVG